MDLAGLNGASDQKHARQRAVVLLIGLLDADPEIQNDGERVLRSPAARPSRHLGTRGNIR